jgi:hypothetical protein
MSEFELRAIDVSLLRMDESYQRVTSQRRAAKMAGECDIRLLDPPTVSERPDGSLWVVDGAHRVLMARLLDWTTMLCRVVRYQSSAEEAAAFDLKNQSQVKPSHLEAHKAKLVAGEPIACDIEKAIIAAGLSSSTQVRCIKALREDYRKYGLEVISRTLRILAEGIPSRGKSAVQSWLVLGLDHLIAAHPTLDDAAMVRTLLKRAGSIQSAFDAMVKHSSARSVRTKVAALALADAYNVGKRGDKRLDATVFGGSA